MCQPLEMIHNRSKPGTVQFCPGAGVDSACETETSFVCVRTNTDRSRCRYYTPSLLAGTSHGILVLCASGSIKTVFCRGRSRPDCRIVGSSIKRELTVGVGYRANNYWLLMSKGCISYRRLAWAQSLLRRMKNVWLCYTDHGQCATGHGHFIIAMNVSTAAFCLTAGGSIFRNRASRLMGLNGGFRIQEAVQLTKIRYVCQSATWASLFTVKNTVIHYGCDEL